MRPSITLWSAVAKIPSALEPNGLCREDGKWPDGVTIVPWKSGRSLVWDATCSDTFTASNIQHAVREARAVAVEAERRKMAKYQALTHTHIFTPVAVETSGACGPDALSLFRDIAGRISSTTKDPSALSHLLQQVYVAIHRGNAAAVLGSCPSSFGYG